MQKCGLALRPPAPRKTAPHHQRCNGEPLLDGVAFRNQRPQRFNGITVMKPKNLDGFVSRDRLSLMRFVH
ncbi:MAG: hypothetical protein QHC90_24310 [Shinella sp.]|nr:hypothetical protein [Shinella sp.]